MSREGSRSSFDTVRELARVLPNVEEGGAPGPPALKVKGKLLAWLRDDPEILAVKVSPVNREYPIVLIRLSRIGRRQLAEVLEEAWRQVAPKRMRAAYKGKRLGA